MDNGSKRYSAVELVLEMSISGIAGNPAPQLRVAGYDLCLRQRKILHHSLGLSALSKSGMEKAVRAGVPAGVTDFNSSPPGSFFRKPMQ
jgi:hypothetical protein